MNIFRHWIFALATVVLVSPNGSAAPQDMTIEIDGTELPRNLLSAVVRFDLKDVERTEDGKAVLWYPKWVPGSHGPGGPIANIAGLKLTDDKGKTVEWNRTPGEVYRIEASTSQDAEMLSVEVRYITNQPTTTSMGHDSFGSRDLGIISPGTVLFYPGGVDIDQTTIQCNLKLPQEWSVATALEHIGAPEKESPKKPDPETQASGNKTEFPPATLRQFVDSPIMCGRLTKVYELASDDAQSPPHDLHLFSEFEASLDPPQPSLQRLNQMVIQAGRMMGSFPFDHFDVLLGLTNQLPRNGLEHSRSSLNVLGGQSLAFPERLKGWDRLLVPHEYMHSWCGKYRRPAGMKTSDFHTEKGTELLWVYEGLTQYVGEIVEARAGWMSKDEFLHRMAVEVRRANQQEGRAWRTLEDTAASSHILRSGSSSWPGLRRSQDYYMEGMLFWLEADAIIRNATNNEKSLDDFCHLFFAYDDSSVHPNPFTREEVVEDLNSVLEYDWDGLVRRRIESVGMLDTSFVESLGYKLEYTEDDSWIPGNTFRQRGGIDLLDSIGCVVGSNGSVSELLLDSPAFEAGIGHGTKIEMLGTYKFSAKRLREAVKNSQTTGSVVLGIADGDQVKEITVNYNGGLRYMKLVRDPTKVDRIEQITAAR